MGGNSRNHAAAGDVTGTSDRSARQRFDHAAIALTVAGIGQMSWLLAVADELEPAATQAAEQILPNGRAGCYHDVPHALKETAR
jgi:hypothetical protein